MLKQPVLVFVGMGIIAGWLRTGLHRTSQHAGEMVPDRRGMATGMAIMGFGGGAARPASWTLYFVAQYGVANTMFLFGAAYLSSC